MNTGYRTRRTFLVAAVCLLLAPLPIFAQKDVINVAAAADMQPVFEAVGPIFEKKSGLHLKVSYGSSATLAEQMLAGSPADIFFSADYFFAEKVVAAGIADAKAPTQYARGTLVLWTRKPSRFNPLSIDVLERKDLKAVAIANADRAPYGRTAVTALKRMKLFDNVAPHFVQAESVSQAAQFALSGNAELALISQTIAMSPNYRDAGTFVLFPMNQYPVIAQTAVVRALSPNRDNAHKLLDFILSPEVQTNLPKLGLRAAQ